MMKNARNVFSKKTLHTENHTKIVWQLPHTQAATNLAKAKPATLVKHCCADLEHRTIATPYIVPLHPKYLHHCAPYVVPLYHSHCVTAPPASYHCTPYIVPMDSQHRNVHCTLYFVSLWPYIVPLYPVHWYIVPSHPIYRTIAPPLSYHCTPKSYHCTPYVVPLYRLHRTIVPLVLHLLYLVYLHHRTTALSSLHHRTCTSHPRTCASYPLKTIIVPTSRLPLRAVLLKFDNNIMI